MYVYMILVWHVIRLILSIYDYQLSIIVSSTRKIYSMTGIMQWKRIITEKSCIYTWFHRKTLNNKDPRADTFQMWWGSLGWLLDVLTEDWYLKIWNNEQNHKSVHVFLVLGCANHKNRHCVHYTYTLLSFSLYNSYFQYSYRFY